MKRICNKYSVVKKRKCNFLTKLSIITLICSVYIISVFATPNSVNSNLEYTYETEIDSITLYTDSINTLKSELVLEVSDYMNSVYPNTKMSAEHITDLCLEHNFDIPLLLSQAHLESHFGKRTGGSNSCFGVVSKKYKHVNESVNDYIRIMKKSYVRKRSAEACIKSGFRVEGSKTLKYAEDPTYSKTIAKIRSNIIKNTNIVYYTNQINELQGILDNLISLT